MSGKTTPSDDACASIVLSFDNSLFSADVVKRAAYRFSDRASFGFERAGAQLRCTLLFSPPITRSESEEVAREFRNEVLDQDLRAVVAAETEPMRNAILAYAFSRTGLQS